MNNNWYNRINGIQSETKSPQYQNRMQYIFNALRNPADFVREQFPDVPEEYRNDPNAVLNYLQRTRGQAFTQQLQQISRMQGRR